MRRLARRRDDDADAALVRGARPLVHLGRLAMRARHLHLVGHAELLQLLHARLHRRHVRRASHDDAHHRRTLVPSHIRSFPSILPTARPSRTALSTRHHARRLHRARATAPKRRSHGTLHAPPARTDQRDDPCGTDMHANRQIALRNVRMFHVKHPALQGTSFRKRRRPAKDAVPIVPHRSALQHGARQCGTTRCLQRPVLGELPFPPLAQRLQHGNKALAARCEAVLHARRHLAEVVT